MLLRAGNIGGSSSESTFESEAESASEVITSGGAIAISAGFDVVAQLNRFMVVDNDVD